MIEKIGLDAFILNNSRSRQGSVQATFYREVHLIRKINTLQVTFICLFHIYLAIFIPLIFNSEKIWMKESSFFSHKCFTRVLKFTLGYRKIWIFLFENERGSFFSCLYAFFTLGYVKLRLGLPSRFRKVVRISPRRVRAPCRGFKMSGRKKVTMFIHVTLIYLIDCVDKFWFSLQG